MFTSAKPVDDGAMEKIEEESIFGETKFLIQQSKFVHSNHNTVNNTPAQSFTSLHSSDVHKELEASHLRVQIAKKKKSITSPSEAPSPTSSSANKPRMRIRADHVHKASFVAAPI